MGLFAPVAAISRRGSARDRAMTPALALIGAFGVPARRRARRLARRAAHDPRGYRHGDRQRAAPIAVQASGWPSRAATGTGVYTTGIQIGSTAAAALAVPLAGALRRLALGARSFSIVALGLLVAWARSARGASSRVGALPDATAAVLVSPALAAGGDFLADGDVVLRAQRLAPRRLCGAGLDDGEAGAPARDDEPDGDPGVVRRPLALGTARWAGGRS